jgi:hypothetical protein
MRTFLISSLFAAGRAQIFPDCVCDDFLNGLKSDNIGLQACAKYANQKVTCMKPTSPYIPSVDSGCPKDTFRCVVKNTPNAVDFKFAISKPGFVKTTNMVQPSFKPCTCTEGVNGANMDCSAGPQKLCQKPGENICYPRDETFETKVGGIDLWGCRDDQERCESCSRGGQIVSMNSLQACQISCGTLRCWGSQANTGTGPSFAVGDGGPGGPMSGLTAIDVGVPGANVVDLSQGPDSAVMCIILDIVYGHSNLKCFGVNANEVGSDEQAMFGQDATLAYAVYSNPAAMPTIFLGVGRKAVRVKCADLLCCAILDNGGMKCWGSNQHGKLGQGLAGSLRYGDDPGEMALLNEMDFGEGRTVIDVAVTWYNVCVVLDNHRVKCIGYGNGGGYAGLANGCVDASGSTAACQDVGDSLDEMGDNLPYVNIGVGRTAKSITGGGYTNFCVILDTDYAKCWGYNSYNVAGLDLDDWRLKRPCLIRGSCPQQSYSNGGYIGEHAGDMEALEPLNWLGPVKQIQSDYSDNVCALTMAGEMKCWGYNHEGQAGAGHTNPIGYPYTTGSATAINKLTSLAPVDLGDPRKVSYFTKSYGGATCAEFELSSPTDHVPAYKCWGRNLPWAPETGGLLGNDQTGNKGDAPGEMGTALPYVVTTALSTPASCYSTYNKEVSYLARRLETNATASGN